MHRPRNRLYSYRRENLPEGNTISLRSFCPPIGHSVACAVHPQPVAGTGGLRPGRTAPFQWWFLPVERGATGNDRHRVDGVRGE
jgi:hypothetical protein